MFAKMLKRRYQVDLDLIEEHLVLTLKRQLGDVQSALQVEDAFNEIRKIDNHLFIKRLEKIK